MPSKNTLTDMFCADVGLLRPVIVTSVDALSIRPDPVGDGSWKTTRGGALSGGDGLVLAPDSYRSTIQGLDTGWSRSSMVIVPAGTGAGMVASRHRPTKRPEWERGRQ
jgi:hypothetical protein